jgi:F420-dependent oxidoreductase-like protein
MSKASSGRSDDGMRIGVHTGLQNTSLAELSELWRHIEEAGVDWISIWDHFYAADLSGNPDCLEAVVSHAALASVTSRVTAGSLVYCTVYRHPAVLANMAASLDQFSGGRVALGLGAGWHQPEARAYGIPFPPVGERMSMLEEAACCIRALLQSSDPVTFEGRYFQLEEARCEPRPVQAAVPIVIGGGGERRTLRIAARYADMWNAPFLSPEVWAHKRHVLLEHCREASRDPDAVRCSANVGLAISEDHLQEQFGPTAEGVRPGVLMGSSAQMADMLGQYRDAGCDQVNLAVRAPFDVGAIDRFVEVAADAS